MFCLSKGLCAPIGSLVVGTKEFVKEAWRVRKMLGGGMRQVGYIAAAGLVALEEMPSRLTEDHEKAHALAVQLNEIEGLSVDVHKVVTNIVLVDLERTDAGQAIETLRAAGVLAGYSDPRQLRFVTHKDLTLADVSRAAEIVGDALF
jgi:threonine aldolase